MQDIIDIQRQFNIDSQKDITVFNPLNKDITCKYDGVEYSISSKSKKTFKLIIAQHIGEYIVDLYIVNEDKNYPRDKARKIVFP